MMVTSFDMWQQNLPDLNQWQLFLQLVFCVSYLYLFDFLTTVLFKQMSHEAKNMNSDGLTLCLMDILSDH